MSEAGRVVSNTGPLISLEKLSGGYDLMRRLYATVIVPPTVIEELASHGFSRPQDYLRHFGIEDVIQIRQASLAQRVPEPERLHDAERDAIQLALELRLPLLIEETIGRRAAQTLGIHVSGIAGQVLRAAREGIIAHAEAYRCLDELLHAGRINRKIHQALLSVLPPSS